MKNLAAVAADLRKKISTQKNPNGALSLRCTRTSEISNFVKNVNAAETHVLKKELNIWHKDTNFELRKLNRRQDNMYRALLRLSKAKKEIKTVRQEKQKDQEEVRVWKRSKRRPNRRNDITGSQEELPRQEQNDEIAAVAEANCLKIFHVDAPFQDLKKNVQTVKPVQTGLNKFSLNLSSSNDLLQLPVLEKHSSSKSQSNELSQSFEDETIKSGGAVSGSLIGFPRKTNNQSDDKDNGIEEHLNKSPEFPDNLRIFAKQRKAHNEPQQVERKSEVEDNQLAERFDIKPEEAKCCPPSTSPIPGLSLKQAYLKTSRAAFGESQRFCSTKQLPDPVNLEATGERNPTKDEEKRHERQGIEIIEDLQEKHLNDNVETVDELKHGNMTAEAAVDDRGLGSNCCNHQTHANETDFIKFPPILMTPNGCCIKKGERKRPRIKMKKAKIDPSEELNQRSSIQPRPGVIYNVTMYTKNSSGRLEEKKTEYDTTVDVAKYFNIASHRERMQRKKLLDEVHKKETQQRHRVNAFIERLNREQELRSQALNQRRKKAEEEKLAFQRRLEAIKRGPPKYGSGNQLAAPNYVRTYIKPSNLKDAEQRKIYDRKRSSWSVPSLFTLQLASGKITSSHLSSSFNSGGTPAILPGSSSSHLVNINIDKYLLDVQEG